MRWIKHLSCAHEDELMAELIEEFGPEGYGVWWIILERIAASMVESEKTSLRYSARNWASSCRITEDRFIEIITFLSENHPTFCAKTTGKHVTIDCPNLLKYRDEYSRRSKKDGSRQSPVKIRTMSGDSPESVRTMSGECPDTVSPNVGSVSGRDREREESGECPDTDAEQSRTKTNSCSPKVNACVSPLTLFTADGDREPAARRFSTPQDEIAEKVVCRWIHPDHQRQTHALPWKKPTGTSRPSGRLIPREAVLIESRENAGP